ncbi:MAG: ADP-glyceromanno-heptose 6-epimerase [Bdellovibrionales bacterium]|nr:ADP-glyceromanno-heptose 6-epimerase [Bdellovibrionales bacterium]
MSSTRKRIIVTGAAGFIGANFIEQCLRQNLPVVSVDRESYFNQRESLKGIDFQEIVDRDRFLTDLENSRDSETVPHYLKNVMAIVHLGACTDTTELDVEYLRKINLEYSKSVWDFAARNKVPLVYASSAATYGAGELGYSDDESLISKLKPLNPYGESKRLFDLWVLDQEKQGNTPPTWAGFKFFNVYGAREGHKGKMASVVYHSKQQILKDGEVKLFKSHRPEFKDGEQKRDFVWVGDLVQVLLFAAQGKIKRGIFNLGSGGARTFYDLASAVFDSMGKKRNIRFIDMPKDLQPRYQYYTEASMNRLREAGYTTPFHTLEEGVKKTLASS